MYTVQCYNLEEHKLRTLFSHVSIERALMMVNGRISGRDEIDGFYSFTDGPLIWYIDREEDD